MTLNKAYQEVKAKAKAQLNEEMEMINRTGLSTEQKNALFHAAGEAMTKLDASKFSEIMSTCSPETVVDGDLNKTVEKTVNEASCGSMKKIVEAMAEIEEDAEVAEGLLEMADLLAEDAIDEETEEEKKAGAHDVATPDAPKADAGTDAQAAVENKKMMNCESELKAIFGADLLTEEVQEKVATLFEAAVAEKTAAKLVEEVARLEEEKEAEILVILESLDAYLESAVDTFIEENALAVETGLRVELMESFMGSIKAAVEDHSFDITTENVAIVEDLSEQVETLEGKLDALLNENAQLKGTVQAGDRSAALAAAGEGLTLSQQEKLATLSEDLEFTTADKFKKKLAVIREQYFTATAPVLNEESAVGDVSGVITEEKEVQKSTNVYADAISRTVKK